MDKDMNQKQTLFESFEKISKLKTEFDIPWEVYRVLSNEYRKITVLGDQQISLGEDYVTLEEARAAIEWYARHLGGSIKWSK